MTSRELSYPDATPLLGLDRSGDERSNGTLIEDLRADSATKVLVLSGDSAPLADDGALLYVEPDAAPHDAVWAFLGRDGAGVAVLAAVLARSDDEPFPAPAGWGSLRAIGGSLSAEDGGAFVEALSLGRWLLDAPFCPACGGRTELRNSGWSRHCPDCGREHFPRTDPAIIVAITSARHPDRLLLGSNALWERHRYSCFAGFAEAGESLEATLVREVREEAGIEVADIRYRGSQAWPYPRSLMFGFLATAVDDDAARADGEEIADVRWFHRDEIGAALRGEGEILLPGNASISRRLIEEWHAGG